jgi:hypothetical protein
MTPQRSGSRVHPGFVLLFPVTPKGLQPTADDAAPVHADIHLVPHESGVASAPAMRPST